MRVLETRIYRGPNLYALWPIIRLRLDLGELEWFPTVKLPGFAERLVDHIPTLNEHTCSYGVPGGFVRRMKEGEGTWLGHVLEHVAIELQCLAGTPVTFGKTRGAGLPAGQYHVVYSFGEEAVGLAAGELAMRLIHHLLPSGMEAHDPAPLDFQAELKALTELARRQSLDPSTAALVKAAESRGIPWLRLDEDASIVQLGAGKRQRRIHGPLTSETSHLASKIAADWQLTHRILDKAGLPVDCEIPGKEYRILVVGGAVVAVAEKLPGQKAMDRTEALHEDVRIMAERAAAALGLDVAGFDFITPDVSCSFQDVGGAIVAVHAEPDLGLHLGPQDGTPRDVAGPVIERLFPPGSPSSIPVAAITGSFGKTTTARMVGHVLKLAGHTVGMATSDGVSIGGKPTLRGNMTGPYSSQLVLRDPSVDAAVLETADSGILHSGLGWRQCSVGAVLNLAAGAKEEVARAQQVVAEVAQGFCVLNADDPRVAAMAGSSPVEPIWVTLDPGNERVRRHVRKGGRAVALEPGINGRLLVLYQGEEQISLAWARQIPATAGGPHNVQNAMFAAAIASGLGVDVRFIREGLRSFTMESLAAPFGVELQPRRRAVG
ncbi:MAG TPA: Mur ligase family protein [Thermoanaerobaculia bacterium]|nr:Mur ligase family protein [Thermoanaerobaculia bacterium]